MDRVLYFAYGSNMLHAQLSQRCPSAEFLVAARLEGFTLGFTRYSLARGCGVLDIVPAEGASVWGGLFSLTAAELAALDVAEAVDQGGYRRIAVEVARRDDGRLEREVVAYQVVVPLEEPVVSSAAYLEIVLAGARQCGLPEDYLELLAGWQMA